MPQLDLQVLFSEKDEAKRLGARCDAERRTWFVPEGVNPAAFDRWLPSESDITVRAQRYFVAETWHTCWKCQSGIRVHGIILPAGHESLEFDDDDNGNPNWDRYEDPAVVYYIADLTAGPAARLHDFSRHYRLDYSQTTASSYWMNHYEHCGMKQGDFQLYYEPGGAFCPMDEQSASRICLYAVAEPFGCNGSSGYGDYFFHAMQQVR